MSRILGLDFGSRTVGVAVSDAMGWTAQGLTVIRRKNETDVKETIKQIAEFVNGYGVKTIVLGYPKNMNNTEGSRCETTLWFKKQLQKHLDVEVVLSDERLTTLYAERLLIEADVSRKKRREVIDKMAAVHILQNYLDCNK